jgi:hypothetical protein
MKKHHRKLWWLHSSYALALGVSVVVLAQKGFDHARILALTLSIAWLLVLLLFRVFGTHGGAPMLDIGGTKAKIRFFIMTYFLKNLYQGMLFFLLPFYWKSTTLDSGNVWFVFLLGICAVLSTMDIVFDEVLMRFRWLASVFHGMILFGCLNVVIPALFSETRTIVCLMTAAGIAVVAFWSFHLEWKQMKKKMTWAVIAGSIAGFVLLVYFGRAAIPPVPMYVKHGAVGPSVLDDGRLAMEVKTLHTSQIKNIEVQTDVVIPGGHGDTLRQIWKHDGDTVYGATEKASTVPTKEEGVIRLRSFIKNEKLPPKLAGSWSVDVETEDGQLVGRTAFTVFE